MVLSSVYAVASTPKHRLCPESVAEGVARNRMADWAFQRPDRSKGDRNSALVVLLRESVVVVRLGRKWLSRKRRRGSRGRWCELLVCIGRSAEREPGAGESRGGKEWSFCWRTVEQWDAVLRSGERGERVDGSCE